MRSSVWHAESEMSETYTGACVNLELRRAVCYIEILELLTYRYLQKLC